VSGLTAPRKRRSTWLRSPSPPQQVCARRRPWVLTRQHPGGGIRGAGIRGHDHSVTPEAATYLRSLSTHTQYAPESSVLPRAERHILATGRENTSCPLPSQSSACSTISTRPLSHSSVPAFRLMPHPCNGIGIAVPQGSNQNQLSVRARAGGFSGRRPCRRPRTAHSKDTSEAWGRTMLESQEALPVETGRTGDVVLTCPASWALSRCRNSRRHSPGGVAQAETCRRRRRERSLPHARASSRRRRNRGRCAEHPDRREGLFS
jgi:hypothetical protein